MKTDNKSPEENLEIYNKERSDKFTSEDFKKLSSRDKFLYFKQYYLPYIAIVSLIAFFGSLCFFYMKKLDKFETTFYCGMVDGVHFNNQQMADMPKDFCNYLKNETDYDGPITPRGTTFYSFSKTITDELSLFNFYDSRKFDTFIVTSKTFETYMQNGKLYNLEDALDEETLKKIEDRLVYVSINSGEKKPYGILMKDMGYDFYDAAGNVVEEPPILAIPDNTKRLEVAVHYIKYIFNLS